MLEVLQEALDHKGWQPVHLARESGVSQSAVSRHLSGERRPGLDSLRKYADALGISYKDLRRRAGYDPDEPRVRPPAQEAIVEAMERDWPMLIEDDLDDIWHILQRARRRRRRKPEGDGHA